MSLRQTYHSVVQSEKQKPQLWLPPACCNRMWPAFPSHAVGPCLALLLALHMAVDMLYDITHRLSSCFYARRESAHRGDSGHISFGGIVQSPSVASVAANIEAVGAPTSLKAPDLLLRVSISHGCPRAWSDV